MFTTMAILGCVAAVTPADKVPSAPSKTASIRLTDALVIPISQADVPAVEAGVLASVDVQVGMLVRAGQPCAQIRNEVSNIQRKIAAARLKQAEYEAKSSLEVRYARAVADVADVEHRQAKTIDQQVPGAMGESEIRRRALSHRRAEMAVEQAELEQKLADTARMAREAELNLTETRLEQHTIRAPIEGVVVEVYKHRGEWVNPGDTLLRIVRMDDLYVQAYINPTTVTPRQLQDRLVQVELTRAQGPPVVLQGPVVFCCPEPSSGEYRVCAKITNRRHEGYWVLRPGQIVQLVTNTLPLAEQQAARENLAAAVRP